MSIYKVNSGLTTTIKFELLNDMILELEGLVEQGKFDTNELDELFSKIYQRKYLRNQGIGNTIPTYPGWSHISAQTGYSIWKYSPVNYKYNDYNAVYCDNKFLHNRGEATSEPISAFTKVVLLDDFSGSTYVDNTTEAGTEGGTEFSLMNETDDYLYIGSSSQFNGADFKFQTRGTNYTLKVEYFDNSSGDSWGTMTPYLNNFSENTSNFVSNGTINFDIPDDWVETTIDGSELYWIRISTSTIPSIVAKAYSITPTNSVISMLGLSSTQITEEEWAWCSYGPDIYITVRNAGVSAYEGDYYITSASSVANLQNFFVYNHQYTADYENSTYTTGVFLAAPSSAPADASLSNGKISFWIDESGNSVTVKAKYSNGTVKSGTISLS